MKKDKIAETVEANPAVMDERKHKYYIDFDFDTFELKTLDDFKVWNLNAHRAFREAKKFNIKADPPIEVRVPDESFHKKVRVKFQRFEQHENVLKTCVRNSEIEWSGQLKSGHTYDLPIPVVTFLNKLVTPIFDEVKMENGGATKTETKQVGERNRFSCNIVDFL